MHDESHDPERAVAAALPDAFRRQRAAYLAHPVPSLAERRFDLQHIARFVPDSRQAIVEAISADFGHRSSHETLLLEVTPLLAGIRQCRHHLSNSRAAGRPGA